MNTEQKKLALFLIGCMGTRLLLVYMATVLSMKGLKYMGYIALLPAIGFMYIYLTGSRPTGPEVFGEKIWWNSLRPIHSIFYVLFAYNAIQGNKNAWIYLFMDVLFGFTGFIVHRLSK
jgi:hypothetical protein